MCPGSSFRCSPDNQCIDDARGAGGVTESYTYDVFGGRKTATEPSGNDFRFTGQQDDRNANRGLYYLRARS